MSAVFSILGFAFFSLLFYSVFVAVLNLLPIAQSLPQGVAEGITLLFGYMQLFNFFFPIDTLMQVLVAALGFQLGVYTWYVARWILALLSAWFGK